MIANLKMTEDEELDFCKRNIYAKVQQKCEASKIEDPGTLLYCKERGILTCCFRDLKILWPNFTFNPIGIFDAVRSSRNDIVTQP